MKTFSELTEGSIMMKSKYTIDNPEDPEVMISGYGSLTLSKIKSGVVKQLEDLVKRAKKDDFKTALWAMEEGGGALLGKLQAIRNAEEEMKKGPYKRKLTLAKKK